MDRLRKKNNYVDQIDFSQLHKGSGAYYLVRGVYKDEEELTDEYGRLKSKFVAKQTDHIRDYSTNMLGETLPEDLKKQLNCNSCFFLKFDDFNNVTIEESTLCKVLHTPLDGNYWHCSLRWFLENKDSEEIKGRSQQRKIWERARSHIITNAIFEEPFFEEIPKNLFIK